MRALINSLTEASSTPKPKVMDSATKARNALVKAAKANGFGDAVAARGYGGSNPYSGTQELLVGLGKKTKGSKPSFAKLKKVLQAAGFHIVKSSSETSTMEEYNYKEKKMDAVEKVYFSIEADSPDSKRVHVLCHAWHKQYWTIRVFGPKKAKLSTMPYYD